MCSSDLKLAATGGHGAKITDITKHLGQGSRCLDPDAGITCILAFDHATAPVQVTNDVADVLVESRTPGAMERLGLGFEELARRNPALVYVSVTPFGQTGPKARWAASDLTVLAAAGALWLMGDEDRPPVRISVPQAFLHAGAEAADRKSTRLNSSHSSVSRMPSSA